MFQYKKLFKCKCCGYEKVETYGDVIPTWVIAKQCPKCKKLCVMKQSKILNQNLTLRIKNDNTKKSINEM